MHLLHLPKLGYTMENGAITGWLVPEGETYDVGAPLYEVETEKNVVQVEARLPGTLARVVTPMDDALGVGTLVAVVADPGETLSPDQIDEAIAADTGGAEAGATAAAPAATSPATAAPAGASASTSADAPAANDDTSQLDAPVEGPAALAAPASGKVRALPKVRAVAERLGVDLASVVGTGVRGALTVDDVERAARDSTTEARVEGATRASGPTVLERRPLTGVRRAMAAGVARSWAEVPQFVQQFTVDLTAVNAYRASKKAAGANVGLTSVLAAAIAHALVAVPEVNSTFGGDEQVLYSDVNIGVAVSSERGLVVPTVGKIEASGVDEIDVRMRAVIDSARHGSLPTDVLATVTLSNLGGYGVETGIPLLTAPQAAIVFVGDSHDTPVAIDGHVEIRPLLGLAVAYDHRIVDGVTGGEFVRALRAVFDDPGQLDSPARPAVGTEAGTGTGTAGDAAAAADATQPYRFQSAASAR